MKRNEKLKDYIEKRYINTERPKTIEEIANHFGLTIGSVKNYMYRHQLNKKNTYTNRNNEIQKAYRKGEKVCDLARKYNLSMQNIYKILKEKGTKQNAK